MAKKNAQTVKDERAVARAEYSKRLKVAMDGKLWRHFDRQTVHAAHLEGAEALAVTSAKWGWTRGKQGHG